MGTFLKVELFHSDLDQAKELVELVFREVQRLERSLSRFKEESPVYQLNHFASLEPQRVDQELLGLIEVCFKFSRETNGAFDIAVAPLVELWQESAKKGILPSQAEIQSFLPNIGYRNLILDTETETVFFKNPMVKIDFGAVGKGYALDRVIEILKQEGIEKARLDFGGHLYYLDPLEEEGEIIGIRNPIHPEEILYRLPLKNRSISTSANYERNFKIREKVYGHLIHPLSGYPVENGVYSVSVLSSNAMDADILSTAIFVLGLEEGMQLVKDREDVEVILISDHEGKPEVRVSSKLEEVLR